MGSISKEVFGKTASGETVDIYTLTNAHKVTIKIITFGGCVQSLSVPDRNGSFADVVTGYDTVPEYESNPPFFGAIIGRVANRICKGKFTLDGKEYSLACNNNGNHLHGGLMGWDKKLWQARVEGEKLVLSYTSPDGEEGYPGEVKAVVAYSLTDDNELVIEHSAITDKNTLINMTNHAYFNLAGHDIEKDVYGHRLQIFAQKYTPKDGDIPTGELAPVEDTLYDLREKTSLGERIPRIKADNVGFDINFCVDGTGKRLAACLEHETSGRVLEVFTDAPGIHVYTANWLPDEGLPGKGGVKYGKHACVALETQNYPDAVNKANFPDAVLKAGETYRHTSCFKFSTM